MSAKIRRLPRAFSQTHSSQYQNLLVSGCSFTYNNSETDVCSWPYYLRDLVDFKQVYDCSQSGAGNNHIFNSVVNEVELNNEINPNTTLIIVMWSGFSRTDVIATKDLIKDWHHMSNFHFNDQFATLSIFDVMNKNTDLEMLCYHYRRLIDSDAQIYQSMLKIIALYHYLKQKNFEFIFLNYQDPAEEINSLDTPLGNVVNSMLDPVLYLNSYAKSINESETCGHPTPNGYLNWTQKHLIPYLCSTHQLQTLTP
jgi:hypothetical protein